MRHIHIILLYCAVYFDRFKKYIFKETFREFEIAIPHYKIEFGHGSARRDIEGHDALSKLWVFF